MQNLNEKVSNVIVKVNERNSKVAEKIQGLKLMAYETKANIDALMKDLINFDLVGNVKAYGTTDKKIASLNAEYESVNAKIKAFSEVNSTEIIKDELPSLFKILNQNKEDRNIEIQSKRDEIIKCKEDVAILHEKAKKLEYEVQYLDNDSKRDQGEIIKLVDSIEPRPKIGWEDKIQYLLALSRNDNDRLESLLIKPNNPNPVIPQQILNQPNLIIKGATHKTAAVKVNNLERSHHYNY